MLLPINEGEKMEVIRGIASLDTNACKSLADKDGMSNVRGSLLLLGSLAEDARRMIEEIEAGILKGTWKDGDMETICQDVAQVLESLHGILQGKLDDVLRGLKN